MPDRDSTTATTTTAREGVEMERVIGQRYTVNIVEPYEPRDDLIGDEPDGFADAWDARGLAAWEEELQRVVQLDLPDADVFVTAVRPWELETYRRANPGAVRLVEALAGRPGAVLEDDVRATDLAVHATEEAMAKVALDAHHA